MSGFKNIGILIVLCSIVAACLCQVSQGWPHKSQGGTHESQGGLHESQVGVHESQGGLHESQGGVHESQVGVHELQKGVRESQEDVHRSQEGVHESQEDVHQSQEGIHDSQVDAGSEGGHSISQAVPQEIQRRIRRQASQALPDWVACDFTAPTKISCHNCSTRIICKPVGGILKPCGPKKPYCRDGACSTIPSEGCA